jgi:hypothetical protein
MGYLEGDLLADLYPPLVEAERPQERVTDLCRYSDGELADVGLLESVCVVRNRAPGHGPAGQASDARHGAIGLTGRFTLGRETRNPSVGDILLIWAARIPDGQISGLSSYRHPPATLWAI